MIFAQMDGMEFLKFAVVFRKKKAHLRKMYLEKIGHYSYDSISVL